MVERADLLGHTEPDHFFWPACQWGRYDATQPMLKWDTAWRALRDAIDAKRQALDALDEARRGAESNGGVRENGGHPDGYALKPPPNGAAVPLVVALAGLTSQSRHSLHLAGSPPSAKLLIPLARRDVRVVERARLGSASGNLHQATSSHPNAQPNQGVPTIQCSSV